MGPDRRDRGKPWQSGRRKGRVVVTVVCPRPVAWVGQILTLSDIRGCLGFDLQKVRSARRADADAALPKTS